MMMNVRSRVVMAICVVCLMWMASACAPMDASRTRSRALINQGVIVPEEEIRVAEYLSHYEQNLPAPKEMALGLDLRLGNEKVPVSGGEVWLQIGVQARDVVEGERTPLNLALVIDRSGSMDAPEKWPYLQQSLRVFFHSLSSDDIVAIVGYSDEAEVVLPAQRVADGRWIERTVEALHPGGGTNLHAGLQLGFQEVERHFDIRRNNRVILLTDGIANRGVTDPAQIASEAQSYNERGIYLSTVGLGYEFNDPLLSQLARQGNGAYHFIDSADEMDKVFRREVAGLVERVANNVSITVAPDPGVEMIELTGYDDRPPAGPVQIVLQEMGAGDSQVVLVRFQVSAGFAGERRLATVTLGYFDVFAQRSEQLVETIDVLRGSPVNYESLLDVSVLRNVTIQRMAEGLREIDRLYQGRQYEEAWLLTFELEYALDQVGYYAEDATLLEDAALMARYREVLEERIRYAGGRLPKQPTRETSGAGRRTDEVAPTVPVLEIR